MIDNIVRILTAWGRLTRAVEVILIDNIAATAPWLAPIIPAWMAYASMSTRLQFPGWVALCGAAVVELLGLSTVATVFQLWTYNNTRRKIDAAAPVGPAVGVAAFYMLVILTVNVMLDDQPVVYRVAKALLSSLSICAAITLSLRSQHTRRLQSIEQQKIERREARKKLPETFRNLPELSDWRKLPEEEREKIRQMNTSQIQEQYQVSDRTARNWRGHNGHH